MEEGLTKKIRKALDRFLVGDYFFSDEDLSSMYREVEYRLQYLEGNRGDVLGNRYDEVIFVSLVNACKEWNSDEDTFWGYLFRRFFGTDDTRQKTYEYLQNVIKRVTRRYNLIFLGESKKKYYVTLSAHALSPSSSTFSFFELCRRIYRDDLAYEYVKGDPVFRVLAESLKNRFSRDDEKDEEIKLGSHVYSFKAWLRGISIYHVSVMEEMIEQTIAGIDKLFNGIPLDCSNSYYSYLLFEWWKTKDLKAVDRGLKKEYSRHVLSDYHQIKPKYLIVEGSPVLSIEPFRLSSNQDVKPIVIIFSDDAEVQRYELRTRGSGLLMATKPLNIALDDLPCSLEKMSMQIFHDGKLLFDSKRTLFRQFVLFRHERETVSSVCLPGDYLVYVKDYDTIIQFPDDYYREEANLYHFYSSEGEVLQSSNKTVFFESEETQREFWLCTNKQRDIRYRENGKEYEVTDGEVFIGVAPSACVDSVSIITEGKKHGLNHFPKEEREDGCYYQISALMMNGVPQTISVYDNAKKKEVMSFDVVKYDSPSVTFDHSLYFDNISSGTVVFESKLYKGKQSFSIFDEEVLISIGNGDVVVKPPVLSWAIDDGPLHYQYEEQPIFFKTLTNSSMLKINLPGELYLGNCTKVTYQKNKGYKLGEVVYSHSDLEKKELSVVFKARVDERNESDSEKIAPLAKICFGEQFVEQPFEIDEVKKEMSWQPKGKFVGRDDSIFRIEFKDNQGGVYSEVDVDMEPINLDLSGFEDDFYTIKVFLKEEGLFKKKERQIYAKRICLGHRKTVKFRNTELKISKYVPSGATLANYIPKPFYVDNLKYLGNRDGFDFYSGRAFKISHDGRKKYFSEFLGDNGQYERINPIRLEMKNEKSCWIVYGLGDDINDFEAEFSYDKTRGVISISDDPEKVTTIQYFEFEKVE